MNGVTVGIDPGLDGGIAVLGGDGMVAIRVTPVIAAGKGGKRKFDIPLMRDILAESLPALVVIEQVGVMPGQGNVSGFNFGVGYGIWQGLFAGLGIPYQAVTPQAWKKAILGGTAKDKQAAIQHVQRRFPGVSLLATPRSRVPHDGICDAVCLAIHARQLLNGKG